MFTNLNCHNIFSTMWRRLSLVVAIVYRIRWFGSLRFCLFNFLFLFQSTFLLNQLVSFLINPFI